MYRNRGAGRWRRCRLEQCSELFQKLFHYCSNNKVGKVVKSREKVNGINQMRMAVSSPEKAGVGGSIPSLATMDSTIYTPLFPALVPFGSNS